MNLPCYGEKNRKLTEVRNLCQCKTRIPLCQLFLSVQFLRLLKQYKKLYEFIYFFNNTQKFLPGKSAEAHQCAQRHGVGHGQGHFFGDGFRSCFGGRFFTAVHGREIGCSKFFGCFGSFSGCGTVHRG